MKYGKKEISPNISLSYIITDRFKTENLNVNFLVPLKDSPFAQVLLPNVMSKGCREYPTQRLIRKQLDRLFNASAGIYLHSYGEYMSVCFSSSYLKNALAYESCDISGLTAEMLYKIMLDGLVENGSFSEEYTEREKENKCQALKAVINNKDAYASNRCLQLMCQGEATSFLYSIDTEPYEKLNGELLYKAYKNMIKTSPVIITYVGEDEDFAERFAKRISDSIKSEQRLPLNAEKTVKFPEKIRYFEEEHDVKQARLVIGFRDEISNDETTYAKAVFDEMYGMSPMSKLFCNVREKQSLCYYCSSSRNHKTGIMTVKTGIKAENKDRAYNEILHQLDCMKKGEFTKEELENAKKGLISQVLSVKDSPEALSSLLFKGAVNGKILTPEEEAERIKSVTEKDVVNCCRHITPDTVYFMYGKGVQEDEDE